MTETTPSAGNYPGGDLLFTMYLNADANDRGSLLSVLKNAVRTSHDFAEVALVKAESQLSHPDSQLRYGAHKIIEAAAQAHPYLVTDGLVDAVLHAAIRETNIETGDAARKNLNQFAVQNPGRVGHLVATARNYYDHQEQDVRNRAMLATNSVIRENVFAISDALVSHVASFYVRKDNTLIQGAADGVVDNILSVAPEFSGRFLEVAARAINDPDPAVRFSGLELANLSVVGTPDSKVAGLVDPVARIAAEDPEMGLRGRALRLLGVLDLAQPALVQPQHIDQIVAIATRDPVRGIRKDAVELMEAMMLKRPGTTSTMIAGFKHVAALDPDASLRRRAKDMVRRHSGAHGSYYQAMLEVFEPAGRRLANFVQDLKAQPAGGEKPENPVRRVVRAVRNLTKG